MKEFLSEHPVKLDGPAPRKPFKADVMSLSALTREYDNIGSFEVNGIKLDIFGLKAKPWVIAAGVPTIREVDGAQAYKILFNLVFKNQHTVVNIPDDIDGNKILQVNWVNSDPSVGNRGLASYVYLLLVKLGWVVISDTAQFDGGEKLWKKLANEARANDVQVRIIDDELGYLKDENGDIISYDSLNIPDSAIWSSGADLSKEHVLLMLK